MIRFGYSTLNFHSVLRYSWRSKNKIFEIITTNNFKVIFPCYFYKINLHLQVLFQSFFKYFRMQMYDMAEAGLVAYGAAIGVFLYLAVLAFSLRQRRPHGTKIDPEYKGQIA